MSIIAIITARSGSKRVPKKNIKLFMGQPIISYPISAALNTKIFDEVMVSTDSEEFASIAKNFGAQVPFLRSEKNSNDTASTFDAIEEVITCYKERGKIFDYVCCIYPCSPFLTSKMLIQAYKNLENNDAVMPVCKYSPPIDWALTIDKNNTLSPLDRNKLNLRSQDITPKYFDVGMFYFCKISKMLEQKTLMPNKTYPFIINSKYCQDIDTDEDWEIAEMKYKLFMTRQKP